MTLLCNCPSQCHLKAFLWSDALLCRMPKMLQIAIAITKKCFLTFCGYGLVWLCLDPKTTWLGLGKDQGLGLNNYLVKVRETSGS